MSSALETAFQFYWQALRPTDAPDPVAEYAFLPPRRWRFDYAWPDARVAVELEGGVYTNGRHVRPDGFTGDCVKYNHAALNGWRVLRFTGQLLSEDPATCISQVAQLLQAVPEPDDDLPF